jgi:hypothetical protein
MMRSGRLRTRKQWTIVHEGVGLIFTWHHCPRGQADQIIVQALSPDFRCITSFFVMPIGLDFGFYLRVTLGWQSCKNMSPQIILHDGEGAVA